MNKGTVYRNSKMADVDLYVTNVTDTEIVGYWVLRTSGDIMNREPDRIDKDNINLADCTELRNV